MLADGDAVIWESQAIVRYLAAKYGRELCEAADPAQRSLADRWMDWAQAPLAARHHGNLRGATARRAGAAARRAPDRVRAPSLRRHTSRSSTRTWRGTTSWLAAGSAWETSRTGFYRYFEMGLPTPGGAERARLVRSAV